MSDEDRYSDHFARIEEQCEPVLGQLQEILDIIGDDEKRTTVLSELEQEHLKVYTRKVDEAKECRTKLQGDIAIAKEEISNICASIGENQVHHDLEPGGNLKEELETIKTLLDDMRKRKVDRISEFAGVLDQIQKISNEIMGLKEQNGNKGLVDETNLSLSSLEESQRELSKLQDEKINGLKQVQGHLNTINSLCTVLGMDFKEKVCGIHPTLDDPNGAKDVSDNTIERLADQIESLEELKIKRMQKIQDLATALLELWHLMDTPVDEQEMFQNVEEEVSRLEQLKTSRMKEIVLNKKISKVRGSKEILEVEKWLAACKEESWLEEYNRDDIRYNAGRRAHLSLKRAARVVVNICTKLVTYAKEILEKVEKWLAACEEESWLEEYNRDDNRYNAGRGAHLSLKRVEKARVAVDKIPAMVEALTLKITAWEERGSEFLYDGVRLLSVLKAYNNQRLEKELERQRQIEIPGDVLMDILAKLPVKSLKRFSCVCKSWSSSFQTSYFVTQHYQNNLQNNNLNFLVHFYDNKSSSENSSPLSTEKVKDFSVEEKISDFRVIGFCNGIFCLRDFSRQGRDGLWNPSTREFKLIPPSTVESHSPRVVRSNWVGFGFDSVGDDYKVLRYVTSKHPLMVQFELYSLRGDSWREVASVPRLDARSLDLYHPEWGRCPFSILRCWCYVNGFHYWMVESLSDILSFDISNEKFSRLPWPMTFGVFERLQLLDFNGSLGLLVSTFLTELSFDLWVWNGSWSSFSGKRR
ncbi:hypothetical protein CCACVL1_20309 [Corchorus capsularis]|uniref:F-box domain-containing protein n=1 Tax=Corchorus capsularis TaxID=210143 RepID=A0A1R3HBT5_COCAP|nr:hypothetical protein CCACVL1_20309 [Corchorus capsularis]